MGIAGGVRIVHMLMLAAGLLTATPAGAGVIVQVVDGFKVSSEHGGLSGPPLPGDWFGSAVVDLGGFAMPGAPAMAVAVGASGADDQTGAVFLLGLDAADQVVAETRISNDPDSLNGALAAGGRFGAALARLPDLSGNGMPELLVGAPLDSLDGPSRGAVWVLFPEADGSIGMVQRIAGDSGGFDGPLPDSARFGSALAVLGDLTGDGRIEVAVGAPWQGGGVIAGTVHILSLDNDGQVAAQRELSAAASAGESWLEAVSGMARFGSSLAFLELPGGGRMLVVGGPIIGFPVPPSGNGERGDFLAGSIAFLELDANGQPAAARVVLPADLGGGYWGNVNLGRSLAPIPGLGVDGGPALIVAAGRVGGQPFLITGALRILLLSPDGALAGDLPLPRDLAGRAGPVNVGTGSNMGSGLALARHPDGQTAVWLGNTTDLDGSAGFSTAGAIHLAVLERTEFRPVPALGAVGLGVLAVLLILLARAGLGGFRRRH